MRTPIDVLPGRVCLSVAAAALLASCQGGPATPSKIGDEFFFPLPPEPPRAQFVRSFNGSVDFQKRRPFVEYIAGSEEAPRYEISKPFSVAAWKGRIYVTDSFGLQGLNVFDLEQRRFYILGKNPGPGEIKKPIHVFVDGDGFKFISDLERKQVLVYGPDDTYRRSYGDGESFLPVACVAHGREVYILDIDKEKVKPQDPAEEEEEVRRDQILVLDKETGKPLRRIGGHGTGEVGFSFASFLAVDRLGNLYVSDFLNHRVVKLDSQGRVLLAFGRHGDRPGDFAQMKGIAVDPSGFIYVVDSAFQFVQIFDNAGKPLFALGGPKAPQGPMDLPAGICIDEQNIEHFRDLFAPDFKPEYLILVANQLSPRHRIAVYAYGKRRGFEYPPEDSIVTLDRASRKALWQLPVSPVESSAGPRAPALPADARERAGPR